MMSTTTKRRRSSAKNAAVAVAVVVAALTVAESALAQVVVQGNRRVDAETIRSYAQGVSPQEARRSLLATGMFSDVRVSRSGGQTIVSVTENQIINRVAFEGNRRVSREILEPEVQLRARGPVNQSLIDADLERIREVYRRVGRGNVQVSYRIVDLPNGRVDVVYSIVEGDKTGVKEIRFSGNNAFSASRLRGLMTTSETNLLSFIKTNDVYDPDRLAADLELIRRYYLKNGYADFRVVSNSAVFDAARGGWVIDIVIEEGEQYRVGEVQVDSRISDIDTAQLRRQLSTRGGEVYNAEAVERSLQNITTEVSRRGYAFAQVRPTGERNMANRTINLAYIVEEGPRVYIERINVRGNTRTRDYVVRRELDLGEGDAYNKVLLDRGERRLNNLGFFKRVRITNEPGSSPDRVIVNVDVEDQPTGAFSISGGYSTSDGFIGEVAVTESNFLGRGQFVRIAGSLGQRTQGVDFSFTEPYFLGYRLSAGFDLYSRYSDQTEYSRFESRTTGGTIRFGLPVTEEITVGLRYSLFQQELKIPNTYSQPYNDCLVPLPGYIYGPDPSFTCQANGEASLAAKESAGTRLTSLVGATLTYNSLDNVKNPRSGIFAEVRPEVAGLGGDSQYLRITADARYYREIYEDVVGIVRFQGGHVMGFGDDNLRILDHFFLGPTLVRGFAPSGIGPRDISTTDSRGSAIGGTTYFGGSLEVQFPIPIIPRDFGMKFAVFADAGTLFGYKGCERFGALGPNVVCDPLGANPIPGVRPFNVRDDAVLRSSVGASLLWQSPLGPIRFDYAFVLSKDEGVIDPVTGVRVGADREQAFRFSGGTRF